ncbi:MAG: hypothetical protein AAF414_03325 [Pseudomonadota bacterium]
MTKDTVAHRGLDWAHGSLTVQRLGAMMAPIKFNLDDGRQVSPMQIAPWAGEPGTEQLPGILRRLRGEWPCVPFGYTVPPDGFSDAWSSVSHAAEPDEEPHGHCSNNDWEWVEWRRGALHLALEYPGTGPVSRVERIITPDLSAPAVDLEFRIQVRNTCRLPLGLHPVFRLPSEPGAVELQPGRYRQGLTYPGTVEPAASLFASGATFDTLQQVPIRAGGQIDASQLPLEHDVEELLQLNGIEGRFSLTNRAENYRVTLSWNPDHFPSVLLWYSNRGRRAEPWNGRHLAIGIEPVCSPFGLGPATALADNPIAASGTPTALSFDPDQPFTTRYRIEAEAL